MGKIYSYYQKFNAYLLYGFIFQRTSADLSILKKLGFFHNVFTASLKTFCSVL